MPRGTVVCAWLAVPPRRLRRLKVGGESGSDWSAGPREVEKAPAPPRGGEEGAISSACWVLLCVALRRDEPESSFSIQ